MTLSPNLGKQGSTPAKHFHIFGQGIAFSRSPAIHMAAFRHYDLPYTYDIRQTAWTDEFAPLIEDQSFGGASVTRPHKLSIHVFCNQQTEHARIMGAINILIVRRDTEGKRFLQGDNTDWSGLCAIIDEKTRVWARRAQCGLIIGAGGASRAAVYALYKSGLKEVFIVNRTNANAEKIASDFKHIFEVTVVSSLEDLPTTPEIIIGTIPAENTKECDFSCLFEGQDQVGLCIDMAYKPRKTPLLMAAGKQKRSITVTGVEVLLNQAFNQFELWTGLKAPREVMEEAIDSDDSIRRSSI